MITSFFRWFYHQFFWIWCGGVIAVSLLLALWLWRGSHYLIVSTEIAPSDVIIVLGGSTERISEGANLYHQGYAPHVLITGGGLQLRLAHVHLDWGRIMRYAGKLKGIPSTALFLDMKSTSTYEDAINSKRILEENGWTSAIVVSSMYHMRRAQMIFEKVYNNDGIRLQYHPAPSEHHRPDGWWKREADMVYVVSEYLKLILYRFKYF